MAQLNQPNASQPQEEDKSSWLVKVRSIDLIELGLDWDWIGIGLDWIGIGLDWIGLDWIGLD